MSLPASNETTAISGYENVASSLHLVFDKGAHSPKQPRRWWQSGWFKAVFAACVVCVIAGAIAADYVLKHAEPIVRKRAIASLSERFHAPVELDHLGISLVKGMAVEGDGLRIYPSVASAPSLATAPSVGTGGPSKPLISIDHFSFHTSLQGLLHQPTSIGLIRVDGMVVDIPAGPDRNQLLQSSSTSNPNSNGKHQKAAFSVDEVLSSNVKVILETTKPGKLPMEFDVATIRVDDVGTLDRQMRYDAQLTNPKPLGQIHATGHFGPWNVDEPRATAIDGTYSFDHADLNTIKGISGILSSKGQFAGILDHITVDGVTDTPNFALDISNHPVPLHTVFHAYVDGTTGDTTLDSVQAHMLHTDFTCKGAVVRVPHQGHDISLTVDMPNGRIEDVLQLGMKSEKPVMRAGLSMRAKLHIPPGQQRVAAKLQLAGTLTEHNIEFTNPKVQDDIDGLSMRAQGRPEDAKQASRDRTAEVASQITTSFSLGGGMATFNSVKYDIPGAVVLLDGVYAMDGGQFEFKGHVRTDATASQMVTGWKSLLLKPMDKFLKKDGAGVVLPISITGTKNDFHFGLAMHGSAEESTKDMAADVKANRQAQLPASKPAPK